MATLRPCVQKQRADGFYPVYIRVIHDRQSAFIKTGKVVDKKSVTKSREIRDNAVLRYCTELIAASHSISGCGASGGYTWFWSLRDVVIE